MFSMWVGLLVKPAKPLPSLSILDFHTLDACNLHLDYLRFILSLGTSLADLDIDQANC